MRPLNLISENKEYDASLEDEPGNEVGHHRLTNRDRSYQPGLILIPGVDTPDSCRVQFVTLRCAFVRIIV